MRRYLVLGLVLCSVPFLGCASKPGSKNIQSSSGNALSKSSTPAPFNDARYRELVREIEDAGGSAKIPDESDSTFSKIGSSMKKATGAVTSALTPKPKVTKAPDPISLESMPAKINANVFYQAGRLAESKGNRTAALKQYERALETDPEHLPSLISLARLHDRNNQFSEAQRLYRKAIEVAPENATAFNDLGLCLSRNDREAEAAEALRHAVSLEPDSKLYRNNLATLLVDMGRTNEAWNELLGANSPAVAHYNVGYLLYRKGDQQQARQQFALALQKDATLMVAKEMLAELNVSPPASSGPSDKVRYRVDDMMAGNAPSAAGQTTRAKPVAMVVSPRELRRIPPTDSLDGPPKPPTIRLHEPIPLQRQPRQTPLGPPMRSTSPQSGVQFPARPASGIMVEDNVDAELPTPNMLNEVVLK